MPTRAAARLGAKNGAGPAVTADDNKKATGRKRANEEAEEAPVRTKYPRIVKDKGVAQTRKILKGPEPRATRKGAL